MSTALRRPAARRLPGAPAVHRLASAPSPSPRIGRHLLAGAGAIFLLTLPVFFTGRVWGLDLGVNLWMVYDQGVNISRGGPSFFTQTNEIGVYYPLFAFYGGTMYTIFGALSAVLGTQPLVAFVVLVMSSFASAYGGLLWLSLQAGLRGWQAHAASLIFVSSPYWLVNIYARSSFAEVVATSAVPLLIAAAVSLVRADRIRPLPALAFIGSSILLTGTHNITMLWGTASIGLLVLVALWALPRHGLELPPRRIAALVLLFGLSVAVNAWFLFPDLAFQRRLVVGADHVNPMRWDQSLFFDEPSILFAPFRGLADVPGTKSLYSNLPMYSLLWAVLAAGFLARRAEPWVRRATVALGVVLTAYLILMLFQWPWYHVLPPQFLYVQFRFRLHTYIVLVIALLAILALRTLALRRAAAPAADEQAGSGPAGPVGPGAAGARITRAIVPALIAVLALSVGLGVWQSWSTDDAWDTTRASLTATGPNSVPVVWQDSWSYKDRLGLDPVDVPEDRVMKIPPEQIVGDRFDGDVMLPGGSAPIRTNIAGGTYLVDIKGPITVVGHDDKDCLVIQRTDPAGIASASPTPVRLVMGPNTDGPVMRGRLITFAALIALFGLAMAYAGRWWWRPRGGRGGVSPLSGGSPSPSPPPAA